MKTEGITIKVNDKDCGCLLGIGNIKFSREAKERDFANCDKVITSIRSQKTEPLTITAELDFNDTAGKAELSAAMDTGATFAYLFEFPNSEGANGTQYLWANANITELDINPDDDGDVTVSYTIYPNGKPTVTAAA